MFFSGEDFYRALKGSKKKKKEIHLGSSFHQRLLIDLSLQQKDYRGATVAEQL